MDRQTERQTLFHRTLLAEAGGPIRFLMMLPANLDLKLWIRMLHVSTW